MFWVCIGIIVTVALFYFGISGEIRQHRMERKAQKAATLIQKHLDHYHAELARIQNCAQVARDLADRIKEIDDEHTATL